MRRMISGLSLRMVVVWGCKKEHLQIGLFCLRDRAMLFVEKYIQRLMPPFLRKFSQILKRGNYNLNFGVKVSNIAEALHLSEEHLCWLFKMHTGTTVKQFITNLKIEKIKDWLKIYRTPRLYTTAPFKNSRGAGVGDFATDGVLAVKVYISTRLFFE